MEYRVYRYIHGIFFGKKQPLMSEAPQLQMSKKVVPRNDQFLFTLF